MMMIIQRPDGITSELPPQPYVDMRRRTILQRVLAKEILSMSLSHLEPVCRVRAGMMFMASSEPSSAGIFSPDNLRTVSSTVTVSQLVNDWIHNNGGCR